MKQTKTYHDLWVCLFSQIHCPAIWKWEDDESLDIAGFGGIPCPDKNHVIPHKPTNFVNHDTTLYVVNPSSPPRSNNNQTCLARIHSTQAHIDQINYNILFLTTTKFN